MIPDPTEGHDSLAPVTRAELRAELAVLRAELKAEMSELKAEMSELKASLTWRMVLVMGVMTALFSLIVKL